MAELQKGSEKLLNAWAFYDWANSVYTLTIASTIFPIFYGTLNFIDNTKVHAFGLDIKKTALISFVTAFTFLVVSFFILYVHEILLLYGRYWVHRFILV